jgi:hypothetical protein
MIEDWELMEKGEKIIEETDRMSNSEPDDRY